MLLLIPNEALQLIEEVRGVVDKSLASGDMDAARVADMQLSNLCVSFVTGEIDKAKRINSH